MVILKRAALQNITINYHADFVFKCAETIPFLVGSLKFYQFNPHMPGSLFIGYRQTE